MTITIMSIMFFKLLINKFKNLYNDEESFNINKTYTYI